jgi:KDO2-lipid IV(A) lauroyltransferase
MVGTKQLVTKSAETYSENARESQAKPNRSIRTDVECAAIVLTEAVMDRPRFQARFLHPRFWPLWLGLGGLWLVVQLPFRVLVAIGRLLGLVMYRFADDRRRVAGRNLELCFPHLSSDERKHLLKKNFASTGVAFFEMAMSWWWSPTRLKKLARIEGLEHLKQAQADGKGVILMALHFTTLEIGAALLGQAHTIDGMYREHYNPVFDFIQRRGRERHNLDSIAVEREDVRGMFKSLRGGRAIWYAPDQDYGAKQSVFVPFFGIPAATVTATSKFATLGRALVVPFTQQRLQDGSGYRLVIHPPLADFPGASDEADCLRINQFVERAVIECPDQYLWTHRRFKSRPPGEPKLYKKRVSPKKRKRY